MAVTIDATVGGIAANSYVVKADVDAYAPYTVFASAWTAYAADPGVLIVRARRALDMMAFQGTATTLTQLLPWPRWNVPSPVWGMWDSASIPQPLKDAQCHIAAYLSSVVATDPDPFGFDDTSWKLKEISVSTLKVAFVPYAAGTGWVFIATVIKPMLAQYNLLGASGAVRLVR